jgi:hypothetical protein
VGGIPQGYAAHSREGEWVQSTSLLGECHSTRETPNVLHWLMSPLV